MNYENRIKELLSVELISQVLKEDVNDFDIKENNIRINLLLHKKNPLNDGLGLTGVAYDSKKSINIDSFCFECKQWYYERQQGHSAWLAPKKEKDWCRSGFAVFVNGYDGKYMYAETEQEAILKATNWVKDNN